MAPWSYGLDSSNNVAKWPGINAYHSTSSLPSGRSLGRRAIGNGREINSATNHTASGDVQERPPSTPESGVDHHACTQLSRAESEPVHISILGSHCMYSVFGTSSRTAPLQGSNCCILTRREANGDGSDISTSHASQKLPTHILYIHTQYATVSIPEWRLD